MQSHKLIINPAAAMDIEDIVDYVIKMTSPKNGFNYETKMISDINALRYSASIEPQSHNKVALRIHPEARILPIMKRKWTVVFHLEDDYVVVDRIIASKYLGIV